MIRRKQSLLHRRYPLLYRRYPFRDSSMGGNKIPLPNEPEHVAKPQNIPQIEPDIPHKNRESNAIGFIEHLLKKINLEEAIIIGIIVLLLNEKIKDEILLLVLIYILLA